MKIDKNSSYGWKDTLRVDVVGNIINLILMTRFHDEDSLEGTNINLNRAETEKLIEYLTNNLERLK